MTRTLPWLRRPTTAASQATGSPRNVAPRAKRRRVLEPSSDIDDETGRVSRTEKPLSPGASPPRILETLPKSLMDEGLDKDDRFRMVEDEFLDVAKQFTQHLHAAEYTRLKKAARSQNAAVINSISRPVTVRMPDETRRKVEGVARAKKQAAAVQGVLRKQAHGSGSDEDSDGNGGAWLGTALHGLMDSPRRSAASLTKIRKTSVSTRAAAGFDKPRTQKSLKYSQSSSSPPKRDYCEFSNDDDDDDDLDAPLRPRTYLMPNASTGFTRMPRSRAIQEPPKCILPRTVKLSVRESYSEAAEDDIEDTSSLASINARERIAKRLEQGRLRRVKEEQEAQKKLEIIPMFLS